MSSLKSNDCPLFTEPTRISRDSTPARPRHRVLFVCLGNICRSPLAEGVFRHLVTQRGLEDAFDIDSAGTGGWHAGAPPDPRMRAVAQHHGFELTGRARKVKAQDWAQSDWILAMDRENLVSLEAFAARLGTTPPGASGGSAGGASLHLFRAFDPEVLSEVIGGWGSRPGGAHALGKHADVPDPYYGGPEGFEAVFQIVHRTAIALLNTLAPPEGETSRP